MWRERAGLWEKCVCGAQEAAGLSGDGRSGNPIFISPCSLTVQMLAGLVASTLSP